MKTATPYQRLSAQAIAAAITAAAQAHPEPVTPESLLDVDMAKLDDNKRAKLNALVAHRLHYHHLVRICRIARAYKVDDSTIRHRLSIAARIMHQSPWREIYQQLP